MSSSDSSSDDASDVEITVRQRGTFSANRSPTVGTAQRNAAGHIEQNNDASARRSSAPADTETRIQRPSEEKQHFEKWEMSSSGSAEEPSDTSDTESDNEGSQGSTISVTERDIADFMLLVPDYAYSNPDSEASRRFRIGIRNIPSELVDVTDANGNTMFLIACQFACEDLVRILLRRGASTHTINDSGANGLHFACYKDSLSLTIAELLLERRVAVNVPEKLYGCTPLHYAASAGNLALCKLLIASGAYIHAHDYDGCDSVAYAKDAGMWDVVDYLTQELEQQSSIPNTPARTVPRMKLSMPEGIDTAPLPMAPSSGRPGSANHPRVLVNSNSGSMDSFEDVYSAVNTPLSTNRMGGFSRVTSGGGTPMRVSVYDFTPDSPSPSSSKNRKQLSSSAFTALSAPPPLPPANGADHTALQESTTAINKSGPTRTPQATLPAASQNGSPPEGKRGATPTVSFTLDTVDATRSHSPNLSTAARSATNGAGAGSKKPSFQPSQPSPYKPLSPSSGPQQPNTANSSGGVSSGGSGGRSVDGKAGGKGGDYSPDSGSLRYSPTSATLSGIYSGANSDAPPLPSPSMGVASPGSYDNNGNGYLDSEYSQSDLSPNKFELYIERAKFNAKLQKEQALHREVLASKDGRIQTLQTEVKVLKREVQQYKVRCFLRDCYARSVTITHNSVVALSPVQEEAHALNTKLDLMQLPFIEATNTLQEELRALRRENQQLRSQLEEVGARGSR
jgi:ankyrin repeat protein